MAPNTILRLVVTALLAVTVAGAAASQDPGNAELVIQTGGSWTAIDVLSSINDDDVIAFTGTESGLSKGFVAGRGAPRPSCRTPRRTPSATS